MKSAAAAAPASSLRFIFPSSSMLQYRAGLFRDELLLVSIVHGLDEVFKTLVHLLALHLARRRDRLAFLFGVERLGQVAERLDICDTRELRVRALHLPLEELFHPRMTREAGESAVGNVLGARPLRYGVELDLDERGEVFARVAEHGHLGDIRARPQYVF